MTAPQLHSHAQSQVQLERAIGVEALLEARPNTVFGAAQHIGGSPLFVAQAKGAYLWDIDGNRYLDFMLGYGSVVLGHADAEVSRSVIAETLALGANPTLLNLNHIALAERLVANCPGVQRVTFMKTGSDATDAAIRLARAVTRRRYVLRWGMNGWHDWCAPVSTGVLESSCVHTLQLRYNDLDHARELFAQCDGDVACAILMPYELEAPGPGYLSGLRELCHANGALFILDEIRSGFRIAIGGAQALFGIEADLVTYGKALGNGYAISALGGRADIMAHVAELGLTVTYFRGPESMAAAVATIDELLRQDGPGKIESLGRLLISGLNGAARATGIPAECIGLPWTPFLRFNYRTIAQSDRALRMFCNGMQRRGILLSSVHHWFLCTSMSISDITFAIEAAHEVFFEMASL